MKTKKNPSRPKPRKFWWIYNQEEVPVAACWARTKGGAFSRFEDSSGISREGYNAVEFTFKEGCSLAVEVI